VKFSCIKNIILVFLQPFTNCKGNSFEVFTVLQKSEEGMGRGGTYISATQEAELEANLGKES
jgi:hypothetical protein